MRRLLIALLMLTGAVRADGPITYRTDPPGASVSDQFGYLGQSGKPVPLPPEGRYQDGKVELTFELEGYQKQTISVNYGELARPDHQYPPPNEKAVSLRPSSLAACLAVYGKLLIGGLIMLSGGLAAFFRLRRREKAVQQVEAVLDRDATASMVTQMPGKLGAYQVLDKLGGGGMAMVYRALGPGGEQVAIKVLHHSEDADFQARFKREAALYGKLEHPNIVSMYDYGQQEDLFYLVLELMEGGTLSQRIPEAGMPPGQAAFVLEPLGKAIQAAHDLGVVHRDLKPDNVMLTAKGVVKVTDFGLGRSLTSTHLTATGTALGTPAYMSPEQICGTLYEPATDQYALGVMAFQLLTGRLPFEAVDPMQACFMHVSEPAPAPGISPQVDAVILRMLAKKPEERYATVEDAVKALLSALG